MKACVSAALLAVVLCLVDAKTSPPKVQVYAKDPGQFDSQNTLICRVSDFYPPDISIRILKNGEEMPDAVQSDLAFNDKWQFHLTKNVVFTPSREDKFTCQVTHHGGAAQNYAWVPNM